MKETSFAWDKAKNRVNKAKHDGIDFDEAKTLFYDERARIIYNPDHSSEEDRFIILGLSMQLGIFIVSHCYRESNSVIRIISARKATRKEADVYEKQRNAR